MESRNTASLIVGSVSHIVVHVEPSLDGLNPWGSVASRISLFKASRVDSPSSRVSFSGCCSPDSCPSDTPSSDASFKIADMILCWASDDSNRNDTSPLLSSDNIIVRLVSRQCLCLPLRGKQISLTLRPTSFKASASTVT